MIKFFRKIRQKLLSEGNTGKYFKYALGEILLVVIGILIALQINNWNEGRKNRQYEQTMLSQVDEKLKLDRQLIKNWIPGLKKTVHSIHEVVEIKNDPSYPKDSLEIHLKNIKGFGIAISFNTSAYEGLKAGGLEKISNPEIRNLITEIYGTYIPRTTSWINEIVRESLYKRDELFDEIFEVRLIPGPGDTIESELILNDLSFLNNRKLDYMLSKTNWPIPITIRILENLEEKMSVLITLLEKELK